MHADARSVDEEPEQVNERRERRKILFLLRVNFNLYLLYIKIDLYSFRTAVVVIYIYTERLTIQINTNKHTFFISGIG